MLTNEENERLARTGPGTPMGELLRRFWIPVLLAEGLPQPDCPPVRVRIMSENLVAFKDSEGRVGLLDEICPHRRASLFWGRNEESGLRCVYHGWKFAIDATTRPILAYLHVTPSTEGGGMWQAGAAPVADADGNVYVQTADGEFTMNTGGKDIGDSTLKLHLNGNSLDIVDWFTPFNQDCLNTGDLDYGASGGMLIPDQPGALPHLMVTGSKEGRIYLLNRDNLGHFSATGSIPQIPQDILLNPAPCGQTSNDTTYRMYGTGTFWHGTVYLGSVFSGLRAFSLSNAHLTPTSMTQTVMPGNGQQRRGVIPLISTNGNTQGIVWIVQYGLDHSIIMHAYDATNLQTELYNTNQNATRDGMSFGGVFVVPTILNGKVFVVSSNILNVYGLLH